METKITEVQTLTAEELEAALHEGAAPISDEALELVVRYRELNKLIAPLDAEKKAIAALIKEEMLAKDANQLTRGGVVQVALIPTTKIEFDTDGFKADNPEVYALYAFTKKGTRFDAKK